MPNVKTFNDTLTKEEKDKLWDTYENKDEYYRELAMIDHRTRKKLLSSSCNKNKVP